MTVAQNDILPMHVTNEKSIRQKENFLDLKLNFI